MRRLERSGRRDLLERLDRAFFRLQADPLTSRSGLDIKALEGRQAHRLRVGPLRVLYVVDPAERVVYVQRLAFRESSYR